MKTREEMLKLLCSYYKIPEKRVIGLFISDKVSQNIADYKLYDGIETTKGKSEKLIVEISKKTEISEYQEKMFGDVIFKKMIYKDNRQLEIANSMLHTEFQLLEKSQKKIFHFESYFPKFLKFSMGKAEENIGSGQGHYILSVFNEKTNKVESNIFTTTDNQDIDLYKIAEKPLQNLYNVKEEASVVKKNLEEKSLWLTTQTYTDLHKIGKINLVANSELAIEKNKEKIDEFLNSEKRKSAVSILEKAFDVNEKSKLIEKYLEQNNHTNTTGWKEELSKGSYSKYPNLEKTLKEYLIK